VPRGRRARARRARGATRRRACVAEGRALIQAPAALRLLAAAAPASLALLLAGCLTLEERIVIEPDGSARVELRHDLDRAALDAARRAVAKRLGVGTPPEPEGAARIHPADPAWLKSAARAVPGVAWQKAERRAPAEGGVERVEAACLVPSLEAAARAGLFLGAEVALERRPKGRWRLTWKEPWAPSGPGADDALGGLSHADLLLHHAADLAHARHALAITFPVEVLSTNGALSEDKRTVRWSTRGDEKEPRLLEAEVALPDEPAWPSFRVKPDLGALTRRFLAPPPAPPPVARDE
jgi:hypothetical protein